MAREIEDKLSFAKSSLQAGKVREAEAVLSSILNSDPQHFDALHLSGIANLMQGKLDAASKHFRKAVEVEPGSAKTLYNLGLLHKLRKEHEDAVACFQRAFDLDDRDPDIPVALGDALAALDRHEEAAACYRRVCANDRKNAEAHSKLGTSLLRRGRLEEAADSFHKAIELEPGDAKAHNNLGSALGQLGRLEEAVVHYRRAAEIDPESATAHSNLGRTLGELGQPEEAVAHLRKALEVNPNYAQAHNNLGTTLRELKRLDEAVAHYRKAIEIQPDYAEAHSNLGTTLSQLGHQAEAVAEFRKAIEIKSDFAEAQSNLGTALSELGRLDEAVDHYRKAIQINPHFGEAYRQLSFSKTRSQNDDDIKVMENLFAQPGMPDQQRMHLAFGLGKAFEDLQDYGKAFAFFAEGNALKRKTISFDLKRWKTHFEKLKETFNRSLFDRHEDAGCSDGTPIFVLGMPRSGTTLIEQILASHADVHAAGELDALSRSIGALFDERKYPQSVSDAPADLFGRIGAAYIRQVRNRSVKQRFITDKMPHNFIHVGMIKLALPNAKIIHCTRDPKDTCVSIFKTYFTSQNHTYAYDQSELGHYYTLYLDLMAHWHSALPGFVHDIAYEDVIADQEGQTRDILALCGLEWDNACLKFYETDRPVKTASAAQVRQPIHKGSVQSWKRYERQLAPLFDALE
jgi:tetratricopeptide (TPR) repeat protein